MEELFQLLESRILRLLNQHDELAQANQQLQQGKFLLVREKDGLADKQKKAIHQIENLIAKLKTIETPT